MKDSTLPEHCSLRYPTMNRRFRDWGTRKFLLSSTCHATSYPSSSSVLRIVANVRPLSCDNSPGTFSSKRYLGRLAAAIRAISKKRVPRASLNPPLRPAIEKAWQGNPPQIRSISGRSSGSILVASSKYSSPFGSYMALYAWLAYLSISQWPTHSNPPMASRPARKPPMPENISKNRIAISHPTISYSGWITPRLSAGRSSSSTAPQRSRSPPRTDRGRGSRWCHHTRGSPTSSAGAGRG